MAARNCTGNGISADELTGRAAAVWLLRDLGKPDAGDQFAIEDTYRNGEPQQLPLLPFVSRPRLWAPIAAGGADDYARGFAAVLCDFISGALRGGVCDPSYYDKFAEDLVRQRGLARAACADRQFGAFMARTLKPIKARRSASPKA